MKKLMSSETVEPEQRSSDLVHLLEQLKITRRQAGNPSYRKIALISGSWLSPSTICRIFNATHAPKWDNLTALLTALGVPPEDLTSVWHLMWAKTIDPVADRVEVRELLSPGLRDKSGREACLKCGAAIAEPAVHVEWHQRLGRAVELLESLERYSKRSFPAPRLASQPIMRPPRKNGPSNPSGPASTGHQTP
jgi:hypothetical protein